MLDIGSTLVRARRELSIANAEAAKLPQQALKYYNQGILYTQHGHLDAALDNYTRAIECDPTLAIAYYNRGTINFKLGRFDAALADYDRAIECDPIYREAYSNRGTVYVKLGRDEEALADYNRAIELGPSDSQAYINRGALLGSAGHLEAAVRDFDRAALLGNSIGKECAARARRELGIPPAEEVHPEQQAFEALVHANSLNAMRQAVAQFPLMIDRQFVATIEQAIAEQVPPEHRPAFEQRLGWLREIAQGSKPQSGWLGHLFRNKK